MFNHLFKIYLFYFFHVKEFDLYNLLDESFVQYQIHEFLCIFQFVKIYIFDYIENLYKNLVKINLVLEYLVYVDFLDLFHSSHVEFPNLLYYLDQNHFVLIDS